MTKITLRPGDYVATADIKDEAEYHAVARAFMEAGAEKRMDEWKNKRENLGWDSRDNSVYCVKLVLPCFTGRQLTPAQILGTDDGKWVPEVGEFPPVGSICNALTETGVCKVRIVAHDGKWCIFKIDEPKHEDYRWSEHPASFSPLPTEEDRAVDEMVSIVTACKEQSVEGRLRELWRHGYRKQPPQPAADMDDPANWRAGDVVEYAELYEIIENKGGDVVRYIDSDGAKKWIDADKLRFHSRP